MFVLALFNYLIRSSVCTCVGGEAVMENRKKELFIAALSSSKINTIVSVKAAATSSSFTVKTGAGAVK